MRPNNDDLLDIASDIARKAGKLLRDRPVELDVATKTSPTDAVTNMDRAAEQLILDELAQRRPHDEVIAEESGVGGGASDDVRWIVDPLDGTVNYLYGIPQFAVSIAAESAGAVIAGVVYDVSRDELYAATPGDGASCNGTSLQCSSADDLAQSLIATGFGYHADQRARQAEVIKQVLPRVRDIRRFGAAALDLCAVARGYVDGYFEEGMNHWDWAAGALIASEAGAVVKGLADTPLGPGTIVAANPLIFNALDTLLCNAGARQ